MNPPERTEEIQDIIQRMPIHFGKWISIIVACLAIILLLLGWFIRYPDLVTGQVTINANKSPIKLIANTSGELHLVVQSHQDVKENDYVAYIKNPADMADIKKISTLIRWFNINDDHAVDKLMLFPKTVSLGELNVKYFSFIHALQQLANYHKENLFAKQREVLAQLLIKQGEVLQASKQKLLINQDTRALVKKSYTRDSTLLHQNVLSPSDFNKSEINYLEAKDHYQSMLREISQHEQQIKETEHKLQQINIQEHEKQKQMHLELTSSYIDLADHLEQWEQKYVFKSPMNGKIQFLKFWTNNHFVQAGEAIFTIVPSHNTLIGQVNLPASGAGKVKVGQEVILKLDNYPYVEYGFIRGKVRNISLTTNTMQTPQGIIENYLVTVDLPNQLKTNYGSQLDAKFEIKGSAEIITKSRRLLERLFDNLKPMVK
ncbi:MAG: HlyD family efflux transporter periplasmic adaptor subunit [Sphingobacteriaceae bacterium]